MEDQKGILSIIQMLEDIRVRPALWLGLTLDEAFSFIKGFNTAFGVIGLWNGYDDTYKNISIERGWEWLSDAGALPSMQAHGLNEDAIIQELLNIEIEAWKRRYNVS